MPCLCPGHPCPGGHRPCVPFMGLSLPMHACSGVWHEVGVWIRGARAESNPGMCFAWPARRSFKSWLSGHRRICVSSLPSWLPGAEGAARLSLDRDLSSPGPCLGFPAAPWGLLSSSSWTSDSFERDFFFPQLQASPWPLAVHPVPTPVSGNWPPPPQRGRSEAAGWSPTPTPESHRSHEGPPGPGPSPPGPPLPQA